MTRLTSLGSWSGPIKHNQVLFLLKIHITVKATHAVQRLSWLSERAVRSDTEHEKRDARHKTIAVAGSCIALSCTDTRQTNPDPPDPPTPTRRCEERECAPRSSSCTLHVVVEAAGPVSGVTTEVVQLRSAVEEVAGGVLHDTHRLAAGHRHCSADSYARTGTAAQSQTAGGRSAAGRR